MKKQLYALSLLFFIVQNTYCQLYTGISGLIHVPSAEMYNEGDVQFGTYFLNKHFTPDHRSFAYNGERYNTMSFYLSATPFKWVELGYTFTLFKTLQKEYSDKPKYNHKDRYFSVKLNPIRESKYVPSVVVGGNDIFSTGYKSTTGGPDGNYYFSNYYIAVGKHFDLQRNIIGVNVAYRKFKRDYNGKWNGFVGGITYQPPFAQNIRAIAEYTGNEVNVGIDCLLWKHIFLQATLQDGKYFSGGVCFCFNLL